MSTDLMQRWNADRSPAPGELCVVASEATWKRDALFFDRIYVPYYQWGKDSDTYFDRIGHFPDIPPELTFAVRAIEDDQHEVAKAGATWLAGEGVKESKNLEAMWGFMTNKRAIAAAYREHNIFPAIAYESEYGFSSEFPKGRQMTFQAALNNLPVVSEQETSWEQIVEFRRDAEAKRKLRDLRLWLETGLKADSVDQAVQLIEQKLDDYQWALHKHGLKTVTGALSQILEPTKSAQLAVASVSGALLGGPVWAAVTASLVLASQIAVWAAERAIDYKDLERGTHREVAFIYEARKKFADPSG